MERVSKNPFNCERRFEKMLTKRMDCSIKRKIYLETQPKTKDLDKLPESKRSKVSKELKSRFKEIFGDESDEEDKVVPTCVQVKRLMKPIFPSKQMKLKSKRMIIKPISSIWLKPKPEQPKEFKQTENVSGSSSKDKIEVLQPARLVKKSIKVSIQLNKIINRNFGRSNAKPISSKALKATIERPNGIKQRFIDLFGEDSDDECEVMNSAPIKKPLSSMQPKTNAKRSSKVMKDRFMELFGSSSEDDDETMQPSKQVKPNKISDLKEINMFDCEEFI